MAETLGAGAGVGIREGRSDISPAAARSVRRPARALALASVLGALALGSPAGAVELAVESLTVEDARGPITPARPPEVGDELYLRCRLGAHGTEAPDAVTLVFRVDGRVVRDLRVPVRIGGPVSVGEYWTPAAPGPHEVACEVNPDRKVEEMVHADNVRQRTVDVRPRGSAAATAPAPKTARPAPPSAAPPAQPVPAAPPPATAAPPAPVAPAAPAPAAPAPKPAPGPATATAGKPDLAIVAVTTAADPGCARKEPVVTVRVTVKNVGAAAFVPRSAAVVEATVKIVGVATLGGRKAVPALAPGASADLEVVARSRASVAGAGGLRYSVVVIVNGDSAVEEVTLDNNGEYVKAAAFPSC